MLGPGPTCLFQGPPPTINPVIPHLHSPIWGFGGGRIKTVTGFPTSACCGGEYYSAVEKDKMLPFAAMGMGLEGITLSEIS